MSDTGPKKGLLHYLVSFATIVAAVATVFALYIAYAQYTHPDTSVGDKLGQLPEKIARLLGGKKDEPPATASNAGQATPALVTGNTAPLATTTSAGLEASLTALEFSDRNIFANIKITNKLPRRVYFATVPPDDSARLILGSGGQLSQPVVAGIPSCFSNMSGCLTTPADSEISQLAYIEPNGVRVVSLKYQFDKELKSGEVASFSLPMIARFVRESSPDPQPVEQLRFDFQNMPIAKP